MNALHLSPRQNRNQEEIILHLLSNVAVGRTIWRPYWQEQIASLRSLSLPFRVDLSHMTPCLILEKEDALLQRAFVEVDSAQMEKWLTWCSFLCLPQKIHETFLVLHIAWSLPSDTQVMNVRRQSYEFVFCFQHLEHLALLEAIEQAHSVSICMQSPETKLLVPFLDPELSVHLDYIRPFFR